MVTMKMKKLIHEQQDDEQEDETRVFYDLSSMIINILGSPPFPIPFPNFITNFGSSSSSSSAALGRPAPQVSPTAFASLFLGISLALMMFGSAIFVIGFILMPWIISLVLLFYFAAIVSDLSDLARAVIFPPSSNDVAEWKHS